MFGECHGHMFMNGINYRQGVDTHKDGVNKEVIRGYFREYQKRGITFFREGGDYLGVSSYAKEAAPEFGIDYRSPVFAIHKKGHYGGIVGLSYETMKDFHKLVLRAAGEGADFIKIMFSGILDFGVVGKVSQQGLPFAEMRELVHICHEEGFAVMVHVNSAETVGDALMAGVDSIEHGNYMTKNELGFLKETKAVWVPTIAPYGNLIGTGKFPDEVLKEIVRRQSDNVAMALALDANVALGSDAGAVGVPHGSGLMDEYEFMKKACFGDVDRLNRILQRSEDQAKARFRRQ